MRNRVLSKRKQASKTKNMTIDLSMSPKNGFYPTFFIARFIGVIVALVLNITTLNAQTRDPTFNPEFNPLGRPTGLVQQADGKILIFIWSDMDSDSRFVRLNADGTADMTFPSSMERYPGPIDSILAQANNNFLFIGRIGLVWSNSINRLSAGASSRVTSDFIFSDFSPISRLVSQVDGKILVIGNISRATDEFRRIAGIMRLNADGSFDTTFNPPIRSTDVVRCAAMLNNEKMLVAGVFSAAPAAPARVLIRLNADNTVDESFRTPVNAWNGEILSMAVQADGKILIGGAFENVGRVGRRSFIERLNVDGSIDSAFSSRVDNNVGKILVQANGKILIDGTFGHVDGVERRGIARLNEDGSLDATFNFNLDIDESLSMLQADGGILIQKYLSKTRGELIRILNGPSTQSLSVSSTGVSWIRRGTTPEVSRVIFEQSNDGMNYTFLGNGSRIGTSSDWELTGVSLTGSNYIRAVGLYQHDVSESMVTSVHHIPSRVLCRSDRRIGPPCRPLAIRVFRYRRPTPLPVRDATIQVADAQGETWTLHADKSGGYVFDDAAVGETYQFDIKHPHYWFKPEAVKIAEETKQLEFMMQE